MYNFFQKHKILGVISDWLILIITVLAIFECAQLAKAPININISWHIPLFLNPYFIVLLFYVNKCREPKKDRMLSSDFFRAFRSFNIIALISHMTIGTYTYTHGQIVKPLWLENNITYIGLTIGIYLSFILIYSLLIKLVKK